MAHPRSWQEAAERAETEIRWARDKLSKALRCKDPRLRSRLLIETLETVRQLGEPFASHLKYLGRPKWIRDFHEWAATYIPKWPTIKILREIGYHDLDLTTGVGAEITKPFQIKKAPDERVSVRMPFGNKHIQVHRQKHSGEITRSRGPELHSFEYIAERMRSGSGTPPVQRPSIRVPEDINNALDAWQKLIGHLAATGWDRDSLTSPPPSNSQSAETE